MRELPDADVQKFQSLRNQLLPSPCRVGGSIPVIYSYFTEFMPRLRRGAMISALATFWMAGNILAAGGRPQEGHVMGWAAFDPGWFRVPRSGLGGDTKKQVILLSGLPGLSELEDVCGSVLHPQHHISLHLHLHARKSQVPPGGTQRAQSSLLKSILPQCLRSGIVFYQFFLSGCP